MDIVKVIAQELEITVKQTEAVIGLIDEGNTIPFIARYRKEATGALNDEVLRRFDERLTSLRNLEERRQVILQSVESQGKLTDELRKQIEAAATAVALEDLYRPYKPKRRTRAMIAREKGLEGLAGYIMSKDTPREAAEEAERYVSAEREVPDAETAVKMALDIIAEDISDRADLRTWIRELTMKEGLLVTAKKAARKEETRDKKLAEREKVYENYYEYSELIGKIPGHRILAVNRGERENFLTVKIEAPAERIMAHMAAVTGAKKNPKMESLRLAAAEDAYKRLIAPSIETEIRNELTERAEDGAIVVFDSNLRQLLMQAPIQGRTVLGWDPAFRTGCKLAVVDPTGKVLDTAVIYPTAPQNRVAEAEKKVAELVRRYHVDIISLGNGTASRESEQIIASMIRERNLPVQYVIVNEAGASVYSASPLATEEFPEFDVGQRSAASIARRLQDPLAELVKIDPKAIGVGQYQHDMNPAKLGAALGGVVEDAVNSVGVDVNTASASLLSYVSGITKVVAKNIVAYREANGRFDRRRDLLKVPKLGPKAFEQCAGFLRIRDGKEPLDNTAVHPESYEAARVILREMGCSEADLASGRTKAAAGRKNQAQLRKWAELTGLGEYTVKDIVEELERPGRDPREDVPGPVLRKDVLDLADLEEGMILTGTVRNVVDFGAFVDIGVHQDGLVHISRLSDRFVKNPLEVVHVGDIVKVKVLSVDRERKKISLSMKGVGNE